MPSYWPETISAASICTGWCPVLTWSSITAGPGCPKACFCSTAEGLIIGSACEAGELYQALLRGAPEQEIARLVQFYDYLEIQPLGNNAFMLREDRDDVKSEEDLKELNRKIVRLGEQFQNQWRLPATSISWIPRMKFTAALS